MIKFTTGLTQRQYDKVDEIACYFDCPRSRVIRVALSLLFYCLIQGEVSYFHIERKLQDKGY